VILDQNSLKNKKGNFKNYHFLGLVDDQIYRV
jgi:hypothetical protein